MRVSPTPAVSSSAQLGLPECIMALLFDLDGVLTRTADATTIPTLLAGTGSPIATGVTSGELHGIRSWYGSTLVTMLRTTTSPGPGARSGRAGHQVARKQRGPWPAVQDYNVGIARHGHVQGLLLADLNSAGGGLSLIPR